MTQVRFLFGVYRKEALKAKRKKRILVSLECTTSVKKGLMDTAST